MLGHLDIVDPELGERVAEAMGLSGQADEITPVRDPVDVDASPALSILAKAPVTLDGRKVGLLIGEGFDTALVERLRMAVVKAGAMFEIVAPKVGATRGSNGVAVVADHALVGGPSVIFDAVAIAVGAAAVPMLLATPAARDWISDAYAHCKVIGVVPAAQPLLDAGRVIPDAGVIDLTGKGLATFIDAAKRGRIWAREETQADKPKVSKRANGNGRARARP